MRREATAISPVTEIVAEIKAGRMVVLVDEEDRENEGDIVLAAEHVTPEAINFMAKHARGLICLTLTEERCTQLDIAPMVRDNRSSMGTNFTSSIEAAEGVTTGISAADRADLAPCVAAARRPAVNKFCDTVRPMTTVFGAAKILLMSAIPPELLELLELELLEELLLLDFALIA